VSAIGHYLESAGIATASISLIREHSEVMRPPRALWVPFPLGRPLGVAHNPEFQRRVLRALLNLFERRAGPVLEDFSEDAPSDSAGPLSDAAGEACPVFFDQPPSKAEGSLAAALAQEISQLAPWQSLAAQRRGASGFGLSGQPAGQLAKTLTGFSEATHTDLADWQTIKLAVDDLRTYYEEAAAAQPSPLSATDLAIWFYTRTSLSTVLRELRSHGTSHSDPSVRQIADRMLIPKKFQ
jgi:hypothetical protein